MKGACVILLVSLLCVTVSVQHHTGTGFDPLREFVKIKRTKTSENHDSEDAASSAEFSFSPVHIENQQGLKEADKIISLPGQPQFSFSQYSGYVTVDHNAGRALFYYFAESEDSSTKPLVLWLNGGPGCSSIGAGAMTELGPFRVNSDNKTLWYNKNAWNNVANVIFLESPAGVGFSYSNRSSDYKSTGDKRTAADSYTFLVNWLERFPEYKNRDFYIAGESYAGHYVPQLAKLILRNNKITKQTVINLKGIAIGNAYIDSEDMAKGRNDFYWGHALISDETYQGVVENCNFSSPYDSSNVCSFYEDQINVGRIFPYDIYAPLCSSSSNVPPISIFDPCSSNYVYEYLNTPEVQTVLHANVTGIFIPGPWDLCSGRLEEYWQDSPPSVLPTIKELMATGISVWIYSGDTDGVIPFTTTKYSLHKLGLTIKTPWYPWYTQGEVGGYAVEYENITFVTIRGAGHFVPSYQPERALTFFSSFIEGKLPPTDT